MPSTALLTFTCITFVGAHFGGISNTPLTTGFCDPPCVSVLTTGGHMAPGFALPIVCILSLLLCTVEKSRSFLCSLPLRILSRVYHHSHNAHILEKMELRLVIAAVHFPALSFGSLGGVGRPSKILAFQGLDMSPRMPLALLTAS